MDLNELTPDQDDSFFAGFTATMVFIWDFLKVLIVALAIILPIRYFIFQPFIVSGSSMEPNYSNKQYLIIDEISYRLNKPQRGEVVVLRYPNDPKQFFIKRIVGLPEEKIKIDNSRVTVYNDKYPDGIVLEEQYLSHQGITYPHNPGLVGGKKIITLKDNEYFVMGDNRLASSDSRDWGPLGHDKIIGKVFIRVLPLSTFSKFGIPEYNISSSR